MSIYDKSGVGDVALPAVAGASGLGGLLGGVGAMVTGVAPVLAGVGGLSGMFGGGASSPDIARAGGTFYSGEISYKGKSFDTSTLIIVAVVVVGLLLIFRGKK